MVLKCKTKKLNFHFIDIKYQATMDCVVNPPEPGEPSYELFEKEKEEILKSLADRALTIAKTFNTIPGMKCNAVQGALYAFPQVC